ncbi:MAG: acyl-CoA thioesterase [Planctomycetaceae bacterium]
MPAVFEHHLTVREDEIDPQGHVNNLEYLKWMQDAALAHSAAQGWTGERYFEIGGGWVARKHVIEYLHPAFAGQPVVVKTWVASFHKIRSLRKYRIVRPETDGEILLAKAETEWAFIGLERHVPRRIPVEVSSAFEIVPADAEP